MPKARQVLRALTNRNGGWVEISTSGSHHKLEKAGRRVVFTYHDSQELGTTQLKIVAAEFGYTLKELKELL